MIIHVIGTINGQINEGMRNIATHLAREFEKNNEVMYSPLKSIPKIILQSKKAEVTLVFARANKLTYYLSKIVSKICNNTWLVLVQRPDEDFIRLNERNKIDCNYFSICENDYSDLALNAKRKKRKLPVGINIEKFVPVSKEKQVELKRKYGLNPDKKLVLHVGHCSKGRGVEDLTQIQSADCMLVASGLFENEEVAEKLSNSNVTVKRGYIENVEEMYQMADVYFFPTQSTEYVISIPLSVMEALSCGVPVIGYKEFKTIEEIQCVKGSMKLVDRIEEVDDVILQMSDKKSEYSMLVNALSWPEVAEYVLKEVKEP